jgi:flagellar protein FliS
MIPNTAQRYQAVQINTSSPGELLLAVYDGLFKFLHQARYSMESGKRGPAGEAVSRAHAILCELMLALDDKHAPELCDNLRALYDFSMTRLLEANRHQDATGVTDVIRVLTPVREAFQIAVRSPAEAAANVAPAGLSELR